MRYLMDSLSSYESGHSDALCPISSERDTSFLGESALVRPVTVNEFRVFADNMMKREQTTSCNHAVVALLQSLSVGLNHQPQTTTTPTGTTQISTTAPSHSHTQLENQPTHPRPGPSSSTPFTLKAQANIPDAPKSTSPPIPGVYIPDLAHGNLAWKSAISQWNRGDPEKGLKPLKEWPVEWYTGSMRLITGSKYAQRKLLGEEFSKYYANPFVKLYSHLTY